MFALGLAERLHAPSVPPARWQQRVAPVKHEIIEHEIIEHGTEARIETNLSRLGFRPHFAKRMWSVAPSERGCSGSWMGTFGSPRMNADGLYQGDRPLTYGFFE